MAQRDPYDDLPDAKTISDPYDALPDATSDAKPSRFGWGLARAGAQGLTFGFGDEAEARVRSALPGGGTYEEELAKVRAEMKQYGSAYPGTALAAELVGGVALGGGAGALRTAGLKAGTGLAAKAAQAVARTAASAPGRMATSGVGQAAIGGFGSAEGDVTDRLKGAAVGGVAGAVVPKLAAGIPIVGRMGRAAVEGGGRMMARGQRLAADQLDRLGASPLARALEPQDAIRAGRLAAQALPGSLTGPTPQSFAGQAAALRVQEGPLRRAVADAASERARAETAEAAARSAREAALAAENLRVQAARRAGAQQVTEAKGKLTTAQQRAQERIAALKAAKAEATTQGRRVKKQLEADLADAQTAARAEAREAADAALAQAKADAEARFAGVVGDVRGKTLAMQESIRQTQREVGDRMYGEISALGQPVTTPTRVITAIDNDPRLASAAAAAEAELRREGKQIRYVTLGEGEDARQVVSPDVEFLDRMRRRLLYPKLGENVVGLKLSERTVMRNTINDLEDDLVNAYGDQAETVRRLVLDTRAKYRGGFELLEAAQLGLDLPRVIAGRSSGLIKQSQKELDAVEAMLQDKANEVAKYAGSADPNEQALAQAAQNWLDTYRTGAREALARLREESPDALSLLQSKKFATPAGKRRLALALGPDGPALVEQFGKEAVGQSRLAAAEAARMRAAPTVQQLEARLAAEPAALAGRARRLGEVAAKAEQVPLAAQQRLSATQEAARGATEQAREARTAALTPLQEALRTASEARRTASAEAGSRRAALSTAVAGRKAAEAESAALTGIGQTLRNVEASQTFVNQVLPSLDPTQRAQAREVMGSMLQRAIDRAAAEGKSAEEIRRKLLVAERNPAVRALMGAAIERLTRGLRPTEGALEAATRGMIGRTVGGFF